MFFFGYPKNPNSAITRHTIPTRNMTTGKNNVKNADKNNATISFLSSLIFSSSLSCLSSSGWFFSLVINSKKPSLWGRSSFGSRFISVHGFLCNIFCDYCIRFVLIGFRIYLFFHDVCGQTFFALFTFDFLYLCGFFDHFRHFE